VFGAGHVGAALARALAPLPVRATVVDGRAEALASLGWRAPAPVRARGKGGDQGPGVVQTTQDGGPSLHPSPASGTGDANEGGRSEVSDGSLASTIPHPLPLAGEGRGEGVSAVLTALPESLIRGAAPGAAFVIVTHDHGLDFLLVAEALARGDAAYVGMIGSATKRAAFARFARARGVDPAPLVCPIGGPSGDKRPAVIAALAAAEVMRALAAAPDA
jgi:xanthine/CO dehydrogenase XdhC/CoxF family maturation factor